MSLGPLPLVNREVELPGEDSAGCGPLRPVPAPACEPSAPPATTRDREPEQVRRCTPTSGRCGRARPSAAESAAIPSARPGRSRSLPPQLSRLLYPVLLCG